MSITTQSAGNAFSKINIPIISTTGYYDGGQFGTMHYLKSHYQYNTNAEHYLLIGPYSHFGAQELPEKNMPILLALYSVSCT